MRLTVVPLPMYRQVVVRRFPTICGMPIMRAHRSSDTVSDINIRMRSPIIM